MEQLTTTSVGASWIAHASSNGHLLLREPAHDRAGLPQRRRRAQALKAIEGALSRIAADDQGPAAFGARQRPPDRLPGEGSATPAVAPARWRGSELRQVAPCVASTSAEPPRHRDVDGRRGGDTRRPVRRGPPRGLRWHQPGARERRHGPLPIINRRSAWVVACGLLLAAQVVLWVGNALAQN
jgi:hypothetical protein